MAGLFVSGHRRSMQGAGMGTEKISSEEQEAVCLELSPLRSPPAPHVPAGHSWIPEDADAPRHIGSAITAREGARRKLGWGLLCSPPAHRPHLVTAHRKGGCCLGRVRIVPRFAAVGRLSFLRPQTAKGSVYTSAAVSSPKCSPAARSQNELQTVWTKLSSYVCLFHPIKCPWVAK